MFSHESLTLKRINQSQKPLFGFIQWQPLVLAGGRGRRVQLFGVRLRSTLQIKILLNHRKVRVQMGGNSPSHFPQEQDEGGGLTLLKGIRVSRTRGVLRLTGDILHSHDNVINYPNYGSPSSWTCWIYHWEENKEANTFKMNQSFIYVHDYIR